MTKYRKPGTRPKRPTDPVDQEDAFVAKALEVSSWAQRNRRLTLFAGGAVVLGIAAFLYYGDFRETLNEQAATQLEQLQRRMDAGDQTGVQEDLQVFLQRFGDTPFAGEARLALGQITAELGDPAGAVTVLEPVARNVRDPIGAQGAALLAAIYEDAGNLQAAEGLYLFGGGEPVRSRFFAPRLGVDEDPATGSAAVAYAELMR